MEEKKAFLFDTNFIVQNKDLTEVVKKLGKEYSVYVTQVSIDERISQQCREVKKEYEEIKIKENLWKNYATINQLYSFDVYSSNLKNGIQKIYEDLFSTRIIPYCVSKETFKTVLDRAYMKQPPFKEEGTDGGLKDTLLWLSIIDYFNKFGEKDILFLTNDKGFLKQSQQLVDEFKKATGKNIEIKENEYYKTMIKPVENERKEIVIPDLRTIREKINEALQDICYVEVEDSDWGEYLTETFIVREKVDSTYVKIVFENLNKYIIEHAFNSQVKASDILELDNRIDNSKYKIEMSAVEELQKLYELVLKQYADYEEQFYIAVAEKINENYKPRDVIDDDILPF